MFELQFIQVRIDIGPERSPAVMVVDTNNNKLGHNKGNLTEVPIGLRSGPILTLSSNDIDQPKTLKLPEMILCFAKKTNNCLS